MNFNFSSGIPAGTTITNADTFSIAWSGQIEPEFSGLYTFYVSADDGARLWVNDQMIASRTFFTTPTEVRGQVNLESAPTILSDNGTTQQIKVTVPAGSNARRFVQLKLTRP